MRYEFHPAALQENGSPNFLVARRFGVEIGLIGGWVLQLFTDRNQSNSLTMNNFGR